MRIRLCSSIINTGWRHLSTLVKELRYFGGVRYSDSTPGEFLQNLLLLSGTLQLRIDYFTTLCISLINSITPQPIETKQPPICSRGPGPPTSLTYSALIGINCRTKEVNVRGKGSGHFPICLQLRIVSCFQPYISHDLTSSTDMDQTTTNL